jgi:hypothetical protein
MTKSWFVGLLLLAVASGSCDPVFDDQIASLGPEAPGVRKGPLHRPGQPCVLCHDGTTGDPPRFTVAGTVYVDANGLTPANGATVALTGADGVEYSAPTNAAGNFYVVPSQFVPAYPMKVLVTYSNSQAPMYSYVGRDGSCSDCHTDPTTPASAGHIYALGAPK